MGLFDIFKRKPQITQEQYAMAMMIAMAKHSRGEEVKGLKIETDPRDSRATNITLDPEAALELLGGESKAAPAPLTGVEEPSKTIYRVVSGIVDPDRIEEIVIGEYSRYIEAYVTAEAQAEADDLVRNDNMEDTWTKNADDTELESGDYVTIEVEEV